MANYIGKEPTPVPLSTADYGDGTITAAKLAPGAATGNIGYTPLNAAGGTVGGNLQVTGTTTTADIDATGQVDIVGNTNITGNYTQLAGTTTLFQDPTLALQAATKQYVDNNFQLATGTVTTLLTNLTLTNASFRVYEFTQTAEFVTITMPDATTLTISNGKWVFKNEGGHAIGIRDNADNLLGAIGPYSSVTIYLASTATAAGKWSLLGDDVRPWFISNSGVLPQTGTALSDQLVATTAAVVVKLTSTKYVVVHPDNTATPNIVAYAIDTSTTPATVGSRTILAPLAGAIAASAICVAERITDTTCYIANGVSVTSHVVLTVTGVGIAVSNTLSGSFATVPFQHNPILGEVAQVQKVTDDLFVYAFAPTAAAIVFYPVKIDGTTIRIGTTVSSTNTQATGMAGWIDMRLVAYNAGTGVGQVAVCHPNAAAAPFNLFVQRVTINKNTVGNAPSFNAVVAADSVQVTGAAMAATFNFGFAVDQADPQYGCVFYYANTTIAPSYNGVYNLQTGTLTSTATTALSVVGITPVATGYQRFGVISNGGTATATTAGLIGNSRGLLFEQWDTGAWRGYITTATGIRFVKISHVGITYSATLADYSIPDGTSTVSGLEIIGGRCSRYADNTTATNPSIAVLSNSAISPAAGTIGGGKLYVINDESNKLNLIDVYAPSTFSFRDAVPTLVGLQQFVTKSGYFAIPIGSSTATTTNQGSYNTWAWFRLFPNGAMRYYGNWTLGIVNAGQVAFNAPTNVQDNEIVLVNNSVEFDQVENINYRRFLKIETAVVS